MTQEQLGIASGLLVVLLTAFWPMLSALESPRNGPLDAGDTENPGYPGDRRLRRNLPFPPVESGKKDRTGAKDATDPPGAPRPAGASAGASGDDPLTSGPLDLSRSS